MKALLGCERITDIQAGRDRLRTRRYGVIQTGGGRLVAIYFRPWPKMLAWPEILPIAPYDHSRGAADRCLLYYNQPRRFPNYLALKYVVSSLGTSYATFRAALTLLDFIAELKQADALMCDVANARISDRLLARLGWEPHKPQRWHRNFIKRFYGSYPETAVRVLAPAT
jgi:hypothetical protein